jgi:hypothetical protein
MPWTIRLAPFIGACAAFGRVGFVASGRGGFVASGRVDFVASGRGGFVAFGRGGPRPAGFYRLTLRLTDPETTTGGRKTR